LIINQINIRRTLVNQEGVQPQQDRVAVEQPLRIDLVHQKKEHSFTLTMRTPGHDNFLTYGILFSEKIISRATDLIDLVSLDDENGVNSNLIQAILGGSYNKDLSQQLENNQRRLLSHSGCGICGKTSLKALELSRNRDIKPINTSIELKTIQAVRKLLAKQPLFSQTGGSHVAGIIYEQQMQGSYMLDFENSIFFEDIGRHNALDKLIGYELVNNDLAKAGIIVLSGRVGFELVQKIVMTGFSTIIALGAPSSLAIEAANQFGICLIGFAQQQRFNLYTF